MNQSQFSLEANYTQPENIAVKICYPRAATLVAATCAILFTIFGILGNLITILSLWKSRKLRLHATTWFVLSLCVSDLSFCSINLPLTASRYIHEAWIFSMDLCKLFPFFFYANFGASLLNIMLISINRYVLIAHHHYYDRIYKPLNIAVMIASIWIFSFFLLLPPMMGIWGEFGFEPSSFSCTILKKNGKSPKKLLFIFGILFPCIAIIYCYTSIFLKVRQSRRNLMALGNGNGSESLKPNEKKSRAAQRRDDLRLTKMMLLIFLCFILCFLPLMIFNVLDDEIDHPTLHVVASILAWASAVINPIIYAVTNRQYRHAYMEFLCCFHKKIVPSLTQTASSRSNSGKTMFTEMAQLNPNGQGTLKIIKPEDA